MCIRKSEDAALESVVLPIGRILDIHRERGCGCVLSDSENLSVMEMDVRDIHDARTSPNDPKLSDGRSGRAGCMAGERWRLEAASVTAERVRCSVWLGVAVEFIGLSFRFVLPLVFLWKRAFPVAEHRDEMLGIGGRNSECRAALVRSKKFDDTRLDGRAGENLDCFWVVVGALEIELLRGGCRVAPRLRPDMDNLPVAADEAESKGAAVPEGIAKRQSPECVLLKKVEC